MTTIKKCFKELFYDQKFGYHWMWIVPLFWTALILEKLFDIVASIGYNIKLRWMLYRNSELKTLRKLSGQDK